MSSASRFSSHRGRLFLGAAIAIGLIGGLIGAVVFLKQLAAEQVIQMSLANAQDLSAQLREVRGYYTANVVTAVKGQGVAVTQDYKGTPGAIPLPATMIHEIADKLSQTSDDTRIRLYSQYPFPWRKNGGPRDAFERDALSQLTRDPETPFWRDLRRRRRLDERTVRPSRRSRAASRVRRKARPAYRRRSTRSPRPRKARARWPRRWSSPPRTSRATPVVCAPRSRRTSPRRGKGPRLRGP